MPRRRRQLLVLIALGASLALAACTPTGGGSAKPATGGGSAPASAAGSIEARIGAAFSLTGAAAVYGASQQNGAKLAVDEVNAAGAVKIELKIEDDASDPNQGINVFKRFINADNVAAIIGPTLSNTAFSADPEAVKAGVVVLGVSNTAAGITDMGEWVFRDSLTEGQVIPQTIAAAKKKFSLAKVAVLYGQDDAFTKSGYDVFTKALADNGITVTTTETFSKGDRDFNAQLTKILGTGPDAIVVSALAEEGAGIISQARGLGITVPIIGGNGFNSPAIIKNAGKDAEGVVVGAAWNSASQNPENLAFLTAYKAAYGAAPDQFATQAYSGVKILAEAIKRAGSADRQAIRDALLGIKDFATPLGSFSFTDKRDADHPAVVQIVKDGKFTVLDGG